MTHPALACLQAQQHAWNTGDLEGYLAGCAADVIYLTREGPVYGREALRARMAAAYPDRAAMGRLSLEVLHLDATAEVRVVLRWTVTREGPGVGGYALVVLAERDGEWRLTHDATLG
ncbi:MAG: nuclear transport factor 2 family protein [Pseudomonadota bacterium]|nr:nuclear transport factor 2 family protein [Pseudomonadota bacterium]